MKTQIVGECRGAGSGYALLHVSDALPNEPIKVDAHTPDGVAVAALLVDVDGESSSTERDFVLVFPILPVGQLSFRLSQNAASSSDSNGGVFVSCSFSLMMSQLKWRSRAARVFRKALCEQIRDIDARTPELATGKLVSCNPVGEDIVWRIAIKAPDYACPLQFNVFGADGTEADSRIVPFERQFIKEGSDHFVLETISIRLPRALKAFYLSIYGSEVPDLCGIFCMDASTVRGSLRIADHLRRDPCDERDYKRWLRRNKLDKKELEVQRSTVLPESPRFSIVVPLYRSNIDFLKEMITSVVEQTYPHWELVLVDSESEHSGVAAVLEEFNDERIVRVPIPENLGISGNTRIGIESATGEWVAFLDYDDMLAPNALFEFAVAANDVPNAAALYSDEDKFERSGAWKWPAFKPDFNRDLLYANNYVTHFLAICRDVLLAGGLPSDDVSGAQDYDMILKASEQDRPIVHVPKVLYHWRIHGESTSGNSDSKPYAHHAGKHALEGHFARRGLKVNVEDGDSPFTYKVNYELPSPEPAVDIIIPSSDHADVLENCVRSILDKSTYPNFLITIVENRSKKEETFELYKQLEKDPRVRVVYWKGPDDDPEFNYSELINFGASSTEAEFMLLLNNDTEAISPDFIEKMLGYLQRPEVGVVGAKLYFRDDLVQHAGMLIGPGGTVVHVNQNVSRDWAGYLGRAVRPSNYSSVTGACQMVRRDVFEVCGGYSEEFAVGFNDADFCCKVSKAGYLVVFTPYAELFHYEFTSRGREQSDPEKLKRWERERNAFQKKWPDFFETGDPMSNPNFDPNIEWFCLPDK